jgi:hypothetical protein
MTYQNVIQSGESVFSKKQNLLAKFVVGARLQLRGRIFTYSMPFLGLQREKDF